MRVLVTGVNGQLGFDVVNELKKRNHDAVGVDVAEMDITDACAVERTVTSLKPDAVIHCAAWTAVDLAEDEENREKVYSVNVKGTEFIAEACKKVNAKMIYVSTDYVFNGLGETPWKPYDKREPISVYGKSKHEGELAVERILQKYYIVRTAWVFGKNGKNFVKTMLQLGKTRTELNVVCDQIGSPTYTYDLSRLLVDMAEQEEYGVYHATNEGFCSWYEFAKEIFRQAGETDSTYKTVTVNPVSSDMFPAKAKRPCNSRMSKEKLTEKGFERLPVWQDALKRYLKEIQE